MNPGARSSLTQGGLADRSHIRRGRMSEMVEETTKDQWTAWIAA
jgi:hypothetical protein